MEKDTAKYKILLTGGGTGGSVTPLLAIVHDLFSQPLLSLGDSGMNYELRWIGTRYGPEKEMVKEENIYFIPAISGKLRRYFSWKNFIDPFLVIIGFFQSYFILTNWRPRLIISAGSFVSVPVVWAGWLLGIPVLIHQQDVKAGLANLLMAPFARVITVTFAKSLSSYSKKAIWTGNPVRRRLAAKNFEPNIRSELKLDINLPIVLILGGGTGSLAINKLVEESISELTKFCQVIHLTGKNKNKSPTTINPNYKIFEFLNTELMGEAFSVSDIVVSRAGLGALTELSFLNKPSIIIPLPATHQEENAEIFKDAAIILKQNGLSKEIFINNIKDLLANKNLQNDLSKKIGEVIKKGANGKIINIVNQLLAGS